MLPPRGCCTLAKELTTATRVIQKLFLLSTLVFKLFLLSTLVFKLFLLSTLVFKKLKCKQTKVNNFSWVESRSPKWLSSLT